MKVVATLFIFFIYLNACKKQADRVAITGTVLTVGSSSALVLIENPDHRQHSFLCDEASINATPGTNNCVNSVFILNLPDSLQEEGKRIQFSKFKDQGPRAIWSMAFAAHDILVYDASTR